MHWLAFVLSDHPHQDLTRDTCYEEAPRHTNKVPVVRRPVPAFDGAVRTLAASRWVPTTTKSAPIHP